MLEIDAFLWSVICILHLDLPSLIQPVAVVSLARVQSSGVEVAVGDRAPAHCFAYQWSLPGDA